jgi:luciferase family oxidoreductase group 1
MRLSVLDQSPIPEGSTGADALHNTLDLAREAERLGFHRYWVAEHHGGPMLAGAAPEVLIAAIASQTQAIRVGSGGVMLPHYSPFKVAETFTMLAALYGPRIDLALGRAAGTDPLTTYALQRDRRQASPDDFPQQLAELLAYLDGSLPDDHPFKRLELVLPGTTGGGRFVPVPWLLGSSQQSAIWAGELGLPYAFADFINPGSEEIVRTYSERWAASGHTGRGPTTAVAVWTLCADTEEEARYLSASSRMSMRMLRAGEPIPVPSPERALDYLQKVGATGDSWIPGRRGVIGTPEKVRAELEQIAIAYGAEEVIAVTITYDHGARKRSYELLADAFALEPRSVPDLAPAGEPDAADLTSEPSATL